MKPLDFVKIILLFSTIALAACDGDNFLVADPGNNPSGGSTGGGGTGGGGTGGGGTGGGGTGGGGTGSGTEPAMVFGPDHVFGYGAAMIAGDSSKLVFTDDSDPLGTNPLEDWQIWSLDLATQDLIQLTTFIRFDIDENTTIDISENAEHVVFVTEADIDGTNPNNERSIFRAATDGSGVTQVIGSTILGSSLANPQISGDGSTIVFISTLDLTGGNPNSNTQLFAIDADGTNLSQVTDSSLLNVRNPSFADNGSKIAFEAFADPFGLNADGEWEIFVIDIDGSNLRQISISDPTPGGGRESHAPKLSDDGSLVVFTSDADHSPGSNTDPNFEVYVAPTSGGAITQLTSSSDRDIGLDEDNIVGGFEVSGDGRYVVFGTDANLVGQNPNVDYTLYWVSTTGGAPAQLLRTGTIGGTASDRDAFLPSIDNDGSTISFVSVHNFTSVAQPGQDKIYTIVRQ